MGLHRGGEGRQRGKGGARGCGLSDPVSILFLVKRRSVDADIRDGNRFTCGSKHRDGVLSYAKQVIVGQESEPTSTCFPVSQASSLGLREFEAEEEQTRWVLEPKALFLAKVRSLLFSKREVALSLVPRVVERGRKLTVSTKELEERLLDFNDVQAIGRDSSSHKVGDALIVEVRVSLRHAIVLKHPGMLLEQLLVAALLFGSILKKASENRQTFLHVLPACARRSAETMQQHALLHEGLLERCTWSGPGMQRRQVEVQ
jgi:hypothetical protein